jgi:hypothetical protein
MTLTILRYRDRPSKIHPVALDPSSPRRAATPLTASMSALMAQAWGLIAGSSYLSQPLLVFIAPAVHLAPWAGGLVVTLSQLGYCVGLLVASSRLNRVYIAIFFLAGAAGSATVSPLLLADWRFTSAAGGALALAAL